MTPRTRVFRTLVPADPVPHSAVQFPVEAAGITVRVIEWGRAGPTVLCLHGLGSHAEVWSRVGPELARLGLRCLAADLPGHGLSGKGAGFRFDLAGHVEWLAALCDALGLAAVNLVGSSLGGLWAAGFAARHPHRIKSLALVGAVGLEPLSVERRRWTADYLTRMDRASIAERLRRAVATPDVVEEQYIEETYRMNNSPGAAASFAALGSYYLGHINEDVQLEALRARAPCFPLALVWGRDDTTVAYSGALHAASCLPATTLVTLEATRHIPQLERPGDVASALARLAGVSYVAGART